MLPISTWLEAGIHLLGGSVMALLFLIILDLFGLCKKIEDRHPGFQMTILATFPIYSLIFSVILKRLS